MADDRERAREHERERRRLAGDADIGGYDSVGNAFMPENPAPGDIDALYGVAGNGLPLDQLFVGVDADAAEEGISVMNAALALGENPRTVVTDLMNVMNVEQARALTIARTEMLGAWRDAQAINYRANSDVLDGWIWSSSLGGACIACVMMDGTVHPLDEDMDSHPNCACIMVPLTKSWDDLLGDIEGLDLSALDETDYLNQGYEDGQDWFLAQSEATQIEVLGPAKFEAWQSGDVDLLDFVGQRDAGAWGNEIYERSLKEIGLDANAYLGRTTELADLASTEATAAQELSPEMQHILDEYVRDAQSYAESAARMDIDLGALAEARTVPEILEWAQQAMPDVTFALDGMHPEVMRSVLSTLGDLAQQYPDIAGSLRIVGMTDSDVLAAIMREPFMEGSWDSKVFALRQIEGREDETGLGLALRDSVFGRATIPQDANLIGGLEADQASVLISHEFGHVVQDFLERSPNADIRAAYYRLEEEMRQARYSGDVISHYGAQNVSELFAESFNALRYGTSAEQDVAYVQDLRALLDQATARATLADVTEASATETATEAVAATSSFGSADAIREADEAGSIFGDTGNADMFAEMARNGTRIGDELADNEAFQSIVSRVAEIVNEREVSVGVEASEIATTQDAAKYLQWQYHGFLGANRDLSIAMQEAVRAEFGLTTATAYTAEETTAALAQFGDMTDGLRAFFRQMYTDTQAWFADQGIAELTLYRGISWSAGTEPPLNWDGTVQSLDVGLRPISSFSASPSWALEFAKTGDYGLLAADTVPVDQILSTSFTGLGHASEKEVIVLGELSEMYGIPLRDMASLSTDDLYALLAGKQP